MIAGALADPDTSYRYVGMETMNGLHPSFPILEVPFFRAGIAVSGVSFSARCLDRRYFFSTGEDFISISRRSDDRKTLGWTSNSQAKPEMLSVLSAKIDLKL